MDKYGIFNGNTLTIDKITVAVAYTSLFLMLYIVSYYNYLLFHTLVELFSVVIGCIIFIISWNTRFFLDNNYLLLIGLASIFIASLDLLHALSYKGMSIFKGYDANLPTQLWITARYMQSLTLFAAPLFFKRKLNPLIILIFFALVTSLIIYTIFWQPVFPTCYVEGIGLTSFKKNSEYIIAVILIGALILIFKNRFSFDNKIFSLLKASIIITIGAELAFTFYVSVYGISNILGHFFKLSAFILIYMAIIQTGFREPYRLLLRNLKNNHDNLKKSEEKYRSLFELMEEGFFRTDRQGNIRMANMAIAKLCGYSTPEEMINLHITKIYSNHIQRKKIIAQLQEKGVLYNQEILSKTKSGKKFWALCNLKEIKDKNGNILGTEVLMRDITDRKQAEYALLNEKKKLEMALTEIRTLRGIMPICSICKKIRDDQGYWNQIESYIIKHSDAEFSHGICPQCAEKYYSDINPDKTDN